MKLYEVGSAIPGLPQVEEYSLWDKVAFLLQTHRFAASLEDIATKPPHELAKDLNLSVPQTMNVKLIQMICEDYYQVKSYRKLKATDPKKVAEFFQERWEGLEYEKVVMLFCDKDRIVEATEWNGKFNEAVFDMNTVVRTAKAVKATSLILVHNHTFGTIKPSSMDIEGTKALIEAGLWAGFDVPDHIIVGKRKYYSFAQKGKIAELLETCKQGMADASEEWPDVQLS